MLKLSGILSLLFIPQVIFAGELPKKSRTKVLQTSELGLGKQIQISNLIDLPDGQKLNPGAPSYISIYEKVGSDWTLLKKIEVNERVLFPGQDLRMSDSVALKSETSELAIDATLYHCAIAKGPCYIDEFQKVIQRSKSSSPTLAAKFVTTKEL